MVEGTNLCVIGFVVAKRYDKKFCYYDIMVPGMDSIIEILTVHPAVRGLFAGKGQLHYKKNGQLRLSFCKNDSTTYKREFEFAPFCTNELCNENCGFIHSFLPFGVLERLNNPKEPLDLQKVEAALLQDVVNLFTKNPKTTPNTSLPTLSTYIPNFDIALPDESNVSTSIITTTVGTDATIDIDIGTNINEEEKQNDDNLGWQGVVALLQKLF